MSKRSKQPPPGFPSRLQAARITAGFAEQKEFAAALGIEAETYRTYERGVEPRFETLIRISKLTNQSLDWLIAGEGKGVPAVTPFVAPPLSAAKAKRAG